MPFEAKVNPESLVSSLRDLYGNSITAADVRAYCASNGIGYQTVTKYLNKYKTTRGKWNLTVQELEKSFARPSVIPPTEQKLIPEKDEHFVCLLYTSPSPRD